MHVDDVFARKSAPDVIADQLRIEILLGQVAGGTQLKQSEVAARFKSSIVPVREAFQRLVTEGLAFSQHNRGVTVVRTSAEEFEEVTQLRLLLEPFALLRSAPHLTGPDFERAAAALKRSSTSDVLERAALHWEFHRILYSRCNMPRLIAQIAGLHLCVNRYVLSAWSSEGVSEHWDESHGQILDALKLGNAALANKIIIQQIEEASQRVLQKLHRSTAGS